MADTENEETLTEALTTAFAEIKDDEETDSTESEATEDNSEPQLEADTEEHVEDTPDVEAKEDSEAEEPEKVFQAPEHWSSEHREQFSSLPTESQELLLARDKEFQTGYQEKVQGIADIQRAIEPWKEVLAQRGITEEQAIRSLFAAQHQLESNPINGILQLAQRFGVLDQLKAQFAPDTDEDLLDPEVKALNLKINQLESVVNQTNQNLQQRDTNTLQEQLDAFSKAEEDGSPKYPHYESLKHLMAPLVGQGKSLEDAYGEVVWSIPEYRESQVKTPEVNEVEQARKVKQAKKAARVINQDGTAKPSDSDEPISLRADLELAFKKHS